MDLLEYKWPKDEKLVYLRPPNEAYHGNLGCYYDPSCFPELQVLKDNYLQIKNEIQEYERVNGEINGMSSLTPAGVFGGKWTLIYLKSFNRIFKKNRTRFPHITKVIDSIPNAVFSAVSILPPNTEIAPHYGDTNGIVRVHLGLTVPESYPIIGMRVKEEEKGWAEGELMCFINVQRHSVWNRSDRKRYVLMVDIVPKQSIYSVNEICVKGLGSQTYNYFYTKSKFFKSLPSFIHNLSIGIFTFLWRIYLPIERFMNK
jgi:aspartyl/asparaginyl beta-hydroxylase (cupin superfamily)